MRKISEGLVPDTSIHTFSASRASPEDVLEAVDALLEAFGLEIVLHPSDRPDQYAIGIDRRDLGIPSDR